MNGNGTGSGGPPNLDRLLNYLAERLSNGWVNYVTAKHLRSAYQGGRVTCARFYFMTSYQACLDRAIQVVLETISGEDALLPQLLAIAESAPEVFEQAAPETVRGRASACRNMLAGLYGQISQLHGTRERLAMPSADDTPDAVLLDAFSPSQLMGLQKAYRDSLSMLNEFSGYYHTSPLALQFVEETIQDDVDFLMSMISGNCI